MAQASKTITLDNGVRIILDPLSHLKSASVGVWIDVGTRHEDETNNGIAHLLEHLVFKGAGGRDAKSLAEDAEARGVYLNASTAYERTGFYAKSLSEEAIFSLDLCSDLALKPHLNSSDFELEKNVVLSEINEAFDDPEDRAGVTNQMASFENQPLGMPILGDENSLKSINMEMVNAFHNQYLSPQNIIIGISGAYDENQFIDFVCQKFGHLKSGNKSQAKAAYFTANSKFESRKIEQTQIALSFALPKPERDNLFTSQVYSGILGGGMASRLFQDLREKHGLVYGIDAYCEKFREVARLNIAFGSADKNANEALKIIEGHLQDIAQNGPNENELQRAKKTLETSIMLSFENSSSRISSLVNQQFVFGEILDFDNIANEIMQISAIDIQDMAKTSISPNKRSASAVGNKLADKAITDFIA